MRCKSKNMPTRTEYSDKVVHYPQEKKETRKAVLSPEYVKRSLFPLRDNFRRPSSTSGDLTVFGNECTRLSSNPPHLSFCDSSPDKWKNSHSVSYLCGHLISCCHVCAVVDTYSRDEIAFTAYFWSEHQGSNPTIAPKTDVCRERPLLRDREVHHYTPTVPCTHTVLEGTGL